MQQARGHNTVGDRGRGPDLSEAVGADSKCLAHGERVAGVGSGVRAAAAVRGELSPWPVVMGNGLQRKIDCAWVRSLQ